MIAKSIKVKEKKSLEIMWEDERVSTLSLKYLRDECPCVTCKGETVLLKTYRPPSKKMITPEMYMITNIETVGEYAIQITWKDGHNTGIYSWEYLSQLAKDQNNGEKHNYNDLI